MNLSDQLNMHTYSSVITLAECKSVDCRMHKTRAQGLRRLAGGPADTQTYSVVLYSRSRVKECRLHNPFANRSSGAPP